MNLFFKFIIFFNLSIISSCTNTNKSITKEKLKLSDLNLNLVTKVDSNILNNNIIRTEFHSGNTKSNEEFKMFAWHKYDSLGRLTKKYLTPPYNNNSDYYYGINDLIKFIIYNKTDTFNATYQFDSLKNILYQYWSGTRTDTNIYYFNTKGELIKTLGPSRVEMVGMFSWDKLSYLEYTKDKKLYKIKSIQLINKIDTTNVDSLYSFITIDSYYYTKDHLDSVVSITNYKSGEKSRRVKRYDNLGLNYIDINNNGIIFKNKAIKQYD